jgi:hypothetical protein
MPRNLEQQLLWESGNKEANSRNVEFAPEWGSEWDDRGWEMPSQYLCLHMIEEHRWGQK